jgi:hypothetical protein
MVLSLRQSVVLLFTPGSIVGQILRLCRRVLFVIQPCNRRHLNNCFPDLNAAVVLKCGLIKTNVELYCVETSLNCLHMTRLDRDGGVLQ